jgi:hypothetical protein
VPYYTSSFDFGKKEVNLGKPAHPTGIDVDIIDFITTL